MAIEYLDKTGLDHLISKIKDIYQTKLTYSSSLTLASLMAGTINAGTRLNLIGSPGTSSGTSSIEVGLLPSTSESGTTYTYGITFTKNSSGDVTLSYHDGSNNSVRIGKSTTSGDMRPYLVKNGTEVGYFITNSEVDSKINAITIPTVGNGKISFKINNGTALTDTFTVNQSSDKVINLAITKEDVLLGSVENRPLDETVSTSGNYITSGAVKTYVDSAIKNVHQFEYVVLGQGEDLPTASADTMGKIYLRYHTHTTTDSGKTTVSDVYDEYITIEKGTTTKTYSWEKIGNTDIDLSGYVPTTRKINNKTLTADITLNASDVLTTDQKNAVDSGITKAKVTTYDGYASTISSINKKFGDYLPRKNPTVWNSTDDSRLITVEDNLTTFNNATKIHNNFTVNTDQSADSVIDLTCYGSGYVILADGKVIISHNEQPALNNITLSNNNIVVSACEQLRLTVSDGKTAETTLWMDQYTVNLNNALHVDGKLTVTSAPSDDNDVLRLGDYSTITTDYIDQQFAAA